MKWRPKIEIENKTKAMTDKLSSDQYLRAFMLYIFLFLFSTEETKTEKKRLNRQITQSHTWMTTRRIPIYSEIQFFSLNCQLWPGHHFPLWFMLDTIFVYKIPIFTSVLSFTLLLSVSAKTSWPSHSSSFCWSLFFCWKLILLQSLE